MIDGAVEKKRPDYVHCVMTGLYETPGEYVDGVLVKDGVKEDLTWCGRRLYGLEFAYVDVSHAALNARALGRLMICAECSDAIVKAIEGHTYRLGCH